MREELNLMQTELYKTILPLFWALCLIAGNEKPLETLLLSAAMETCKVVVPQVVTYISEQAIQTRLQALHKNAYVMSWVS
jgi:hypothetical protein